MLHPTRTNLLLLKDKAKSVSGSISILRARRQALIREFLATTAPFIKSREEIGQLYRQGIEDLGVARGRDGEDAIASLCEVTQRPLRVRVTTESIWGLSFKNVEPEDEVVRQVDERGYDYRSTSLPLEESIYRFERVLESVILLAKYENKLKKLSREIEKTTRRIRVLEEKILPGIRAETKSISLYLSEREREAVYRLKMFKSMRE